MEEGNNTVKQAATKGKRFLGLFIDWIIAGVLASIVSMFVGFLGPIVAFAYILTRDGLPFLQFDSIGKKLMKLTVRKQDGSQTDMQASISRNLFLAIAWLPGILGYLGLGMIGTIASFAGFILIILEAINVFQDKPRMGDNRAGTYVTEL